MMYDTVKNLLHFVDISFGVEFTKHSQVIDI